MKIMIKKQWSGKIIFWWLIFLVLEIFSFSAFLAPDLNWLFFGLITIGVLLISLWRLEYGLLITLAELFIGSFGYLFYFQLGDFKFPLRMALWGVILLIFVVKFTYQLFVFGSKSIFLEKIKNFIFLKDFSLLFLFIIIGLFVGWQNNNDLRVIFLDFNAWLYFALLFPIITVFSQRSLSQNHRLQVVFLAAVLWLSLKTLTLLFIFTHNLGIAPDIYSWLRRHLLAEVTPTSSGWPRVFIQSQIFPIIAFLLVFFYNLKALVTKEFLKKPSIIILLIASLFLSTALISFSRSFWVGLMVALSISFLIVWRLYSFKKMLLALVWSLVSLAGAFILIYLVVIFPFPKPANFQVDFLDRLSNQNEAALSSRWSLLPVLIREVGQEPFFGQGFGATVTYFSQDPRVLEKEPSGRYTTFAFEWGYLDIALKIGVVGLLAYILILMRMIITAWQIGRRELNYLTLGLGVSLIFLATVNIFTPYLNHPLGIGTLLLSSCLIPLNRV